MTPDQKRDALAVACLRFPVSVCKNDKRCPVYGGVCTYFGDISDKKACRLYAKAIKRGAIKEEQ